MDYKKLADLLYPNLEKDMNYYLNYYKKRKLPIGAEVTRIAPSPTGFLHIGTLMGATIDYLVAYKSGGVFYFRLEDTDQKREIENAANIVFQGICELGITPSEGFRGSLEKELGEYGPYVQSKRIEIYNAFAKHLVSIGRAFPCFCQKTEGKAEILEKREKMLEQTNTLEEHDCCRNLTLEEINARIKSGSKFALRLLSFGNPNKTIKIIDGIKGEREIRENCKDIILIKNNGVPVYSFAHIVDDTLMGTTMVVRGEEWFQSLASHIELFEAFGFKIPKYSHTPVISITENGNKRKLSKRKDVEADARYFLKNGYTTEAVIEYIVNLINSDFEEWRLKNPMNKYTDFDFRLEKIGSNNPNLDINKINDISKNYIARLNANQVYDSVVSWAQKYDTIFYKYLVSNKEYCINVFNIDRDIEKPRKDIYNWSMIKSYFNYMFNDYETLNFDFPKNTKYSSELILQIMNKYTNSFNPKSTKTEWFDELKIMAKSFNFCCDNKEYKLNPDNYLGNMGEFCNLIRVSITGKQNTPDLYTICKVLGKDELLIRSTKLKNVIFKFI